MMVRVGLLGALIAVVLALSGCGNDEAAQRKAFIEFLQTRIIDKPGVHVPTLTPEIQDKIGVYATHYAVITGFNSDMDQAVGGFLPKAMGIVSITSIGDAVAKREAIAGVRTEIASIRAALTQKLAAAEAAKVALTQPEDLKPVFDAAFDCDVRSTANAFIRELPLFESTMTAILTLTDYLDKNRDKVTVQGSTVVANDPKARAEINALLDDINTKSRLLAESQLRIAKIATGG
jgi:hypothetical protein